MPLSRVGNILGQANQLRPVRDLRRSFGGSADGYYLRDSRHAHRNFGLNNSVFVENTPRQRFQFFVRFNFNQEDENVRAFVERFLDVEDQYFITSLVKRFTPPSVNVETEKLNQYNKWRITQTNITHEPIDVVFHDTIDGKVMRIWEMYYEYYFRDGVTRYKLDENTDGRSHKGSEYVDDIIPQSSVYSDGSNDQSIDYVNRWGYNLPQVGNVRNLIKSIDFFQVHGSRAARTEIMHPRIVSFSQSEQDYSQSETSEATMRIEYETIVYQNNYDILTSTELWNYRNGDYLELSDTVKLPIPVRQRELFAEEEFPARGLARAYSSVGNLLRGDDPRDIARIQLQESGAITNVQGLLNDTIDTGLGTVNQSASSWSIFGNNSNVSGIGGG